MLSFTPRHGLQSTRARATQAKPCLLTEQQPHTSLRLRTPADPIGLLNQLLALYQRGLQEPLAFFPKSAWAYVDEDDSLCFRDQQLPGRTGKAGRPGQALVRIRQVLVLVLVVMRHVEAIKALRGEFTAE